MIYDRKDHQARICLRFPRLAHTQPSFVGKNLVDDAIGRESQTVSSASVNGPLVKAPRLSSTITTAATDHDKPCIIRSAFASWYKMIDLQVFCCSAVDATLVPGEHECGELWIATPERFAIWTGGPFGTVHVFTSLLTPQPPRLFGPF